MNRDILLVEDNKINQLVARKVLEKSSFTVDVAASADEAFAKMQAVQYKLVLMDVQMPGTDGAEATRRIRTGDVVVADSSIPIVAMTAYTSDSDQAKFAECGMNGFLSKPLDVDELIERATEFISGKSNTPALDVDDLHTRVVGDRELAQEVITDFLTTLPERYQEAMVAVDSDDWKTAQRAGHTVAGAASNIGAREMTELGRSIEAAAKNRTVTEIRTLLGRVENAFQRLRQALSDAGYRV